MTALGLAVCVVLTVLYLSFLIR